MFCGVHADHPSLSLSQVSVQDVYITLHEDCCTVAIHAVADWLLEIVHTTNTTIPLVHYFGRVNVYLCGTLLRSASNALPLPVRRHWSPQASPTARHRRTLRDCRYRLVYHAVCLFTAPAFAGYSSSLTTEAGSGWVGLGDWFCAEVVYPSKDGHPPRH